MVIVLNDHYSTPRDPYFSPVDPFIISNNIPAAWHIIEAVRVILYDLKISTAISLLLFDAGGRSVTHPSNLRYWLRS